MSVLIFSIHWQVMVVLLPLAGAIACFLWPRRGVMLALVCALGTTLSVAGLSWLVVVEGAQRYTVGGWGAPLGIDLYVDGLSLLMLIVTSVVGVAISVYANGYFERSRARAFWPLWLFLWGALNALFLSADIFNLYITLELLGLAAVTLVALAKGAQPLSSAMRYLLVTLLGSLLFLLGVALLYHSSGSVDIAILAERLSASPVVWIALGLMVVGLLLKTALFPLHFWLPQAHASAPAPVSALLSALVVKASFYILIRLWLEIFPPNNFVLGQLLGLLGAAALLWGNLQALRQTRLKMLIAYSTVAQLGYLFLAFPLANIIGWTGALYMLLSHAIAKAAMFMAAGNILRFGGHDSIADLDRIVQRLPLTVTTFALAGVSIMGLPPSGGFVAKWLLLEAAIRSAQWWWGVVLVLGGLLSAVWIFKVVGYAFTPSPVPHEVRAVPASMEWSALALALTAIALGLFSSWPLALMMVGLPFGEGGGS